jgi:enoyl-CoA hydratase/carnithine racemase
MSEVLVDINEGVATVTLNRPEVKNAISWSVVDALTDAGRSLARQPEVRAVVVTGAEGVFCSGIDITTFAGDGGGEFEPAFAQIARFQRAFDVFEELGRPVIAAVEKYCYGAGFQLAIACDLRVIADGAQLSVMETKWGIIPDLGATTRLPRLIGLSRAKDLAMTARIIDADEADRFGLVDRRAPEGGALKTATELARELAAGPPMALEGIKRLMNASFDTPVTQGLQREQAVQRRMLASKDFTEAVTARFEKRKPRYEGK